MSCNPIKILNTIGVAMGFLTFGLFIASEVHAWVVIEPTGILCENPDYGVMWHMNSAVPMQFRLMFYRVGGGIYRDYGFLLPAAAILALGFTLMIGKGVQCLEKGLGRRISRPNDPADLD